MDIATMHFWGKTKYWWALIITGILMIPCGLWLWFQPALGYEVLSLLLGWLLILFELFSSLYRAMLNKKFEDGAGGLPVELSIYLSGLY